MLSLKNRVGNFLLLFGLIALLIFVATAITPPSRLDVWAFLAGAAMVGVGVRFRLDKKGRPLVRPPPHPAGPPPARAAAAKGKGPGKGGSGPGPGGPPGGGGGPPKPAKRGLLSALALGPPSHKGGPKGGAPGGPPPGGGKPGGGKPRK